MLAAFLEEVLQRPVERQGTRRVAVLLADRHGGAARYLPDHEQALDAPGVSTEPVFLRPGELPSAAALSGVAGVVVGGGDPGGYLDGLEHVRHEIRRAVGSGAPYLGFSVDHPRPAGSARVGEDDPVHRSQRMRWADAAWFRFDRPENRLVVTAVLHLSDLLGVDDLRDRVQERVVVRHPRLAQVARRRTVPLSRPRWHPDPTFDLRRHVVDATDGSPRDDEGLRRLAAELFARPLDPDRPPWQIHVVRRAGGGSALVARFHHSLGDGSALASVLLRLTDSGAPDAGAEAGAGAGAEAGAAAAPAAARRRVRDAARAAAGAVGVVVRLLAAPAEPATRLRGPLATRKALALTTTHDLDGVRRAARAHGVSINDMLLAATAGGLRHQLSRSGGVVADLRVLMPIDLRGGAPVPVGLGNVFGVVFARLPVGEADPARRLAAVHADTARLKVSSEAGGTYLLLHLVGAFPRVVRWLAVALMERGASAVVTNVPGPRRPLTVGDCRVDDVAFWAPAVGRIGLGISLLSYAGSITVGVAVDAGLGLDATALAQAIEDELAALARVAV